MYVKINSFKETESLFECKTVLCYFLYSLSIPAIKRQIAAEFIL